MPSAEYLRYLQSPQWRHLRARVLARDHHMCQDCGARTPLHVHHLTYARIFHERPSDLITVCDACHRARHKIPAPRRPALHPVRRQRRRWTRKLRRTAAALIIVVWWIIVVAIIISAAVTKV